MIKRTILLLLIFLSQFYIIADLPCQPLKFVLSSKKSLYCEGEKMEFTLRITNEDKKNTWPVLLPGKEIVGKMLVYFRVYVVEDKVAKVLGTEVRELYSDAGNTAIKQLKPGQSVNITLYLNDYKNYYKTGASHHYLPCQLKPGTYFFQVFYNPNGIARQEMYHYIHSTDDDYPPGKLVFAATGELSTACKIKIIKKTYSQKTTAILNCNEKCNFCNKVYAKKWKKVSRIIHTNSVYFNQEGRFHPGNDFGNWFSKHRSVNCLDAPPESVNCSLPTGYSREIGFYDKSKPEVNYFYMVFQMGKIYPRAARLQRIISCLIQHRIHWFKTEDIYYFGLKSFVPLRTNNP